MSTDPTAKANLSTTLPDISQAAQPSHGPEYTQRGHYIHGPHASGHADQHNGDNIYYYNNRECMDFRGGIENVTYA